MKRTPSNPTTKAAVAKALAELGVELPPSRVKKTALADLIRMLDEAHAAKAKPAKKPRVKRAANVVPLKPRKSKGISLDLKPADRIAACCEGTRQAALIDPMKAGATIWEMLGACPAGARAASNPLVLAGEPGEGLWHPHRDASQPSS